MPPTPSAVANDALRAFVMAKGGRPWWPEDLAELARLRAVYLEAKRAEYEKAA